MKIAIRCVRFTVLDFDSAFADIPAGGDAGNFPAFFDKFAGIVVADQNNCDKRESM